MHIRLPDAGVWASSPASRALVRYARQRPLPADVAVAYSGGADSTALLLAAAHQALASGLDRDRPLLVFHVHHGLQPAADAFVLHAEAFCAALDRHVPTRLVVARVAVPLPSGASVEAQARKARYAALSDLARQHGAGTVLLGQHADDQVETILIALGRGAGVAGLAGMDVEVVRDGIRFARPLLDVPGPALRAWQHEHGVAYVDDPANRDDRFTRNRLRLHVLPALEHALPAMRETFARSARLARQAQALIDEVAIEDAARVGEPPAIAALHGLSRARQANVLRRWLRVHHATTPTEAQLVELLDVIAACITRGHGIDLRIGRGHVRREGAHLRFDPAPSPSGT
jgi:tRNA(Ile)-lysidine synthase